jgi:hypothetical protein
MWISALIVAVALAPAAPPATLTASEAKKHVGETATVCGKVMSPRYATKTKGQPTFLNIDKAYPYQVFTVVIWGADRAKFGAPEVTYRDKSICTTGKILEYEGAAEIVATAASQIEVQKQ